MNHIPPYAEQLAQAESIARAELAGQQTDREEAVWYGVRETFSKGLPEEVLQQAADRVELSIAKNP